MKEFLNKNEIFIDTAPIYITCGSSRIFFYCGMAISSKTCYDNFGNRSIPVRIGENGGASKKFGVKPPKPEFYKGKRDALEINAWVDQIERYARYFGLSEGMELVDFAVFYLGGSARDWWTNRSDQLKEKVEGWKDFTKELKISFYPLDHQRTVMDKLEKLCQK